MLGAGTDFLLIVVALAATAVGIRGETWNENAIGSKKLTRSGRYALALAAFYAVLSGYSVVSEKLEFNKQRRYALSELVRSVNEVEDVLIDAGQLMRNESDMFSWSELDAMFDARVAVAHVKFPVMERYLHAHERDEFVSILSFIEEERRVRPELEYQGRNFSQILKSLNDHLRRRFCSEISFQQEEYRSCLGRYLKTYD